MSSWEELRAAYGGSASSATEDADPWAALKKRTLASVQGPEEKPKPAPVTDFSGTLRLGPLDTGIELPQGVNKRLAQLGSGFADYVTRAQQLMGKASESDVDQKRKIDAGLNDDWTGKALNFTGKALPAFAVPQIAGAPIVSGMLAGGLSGFAEPVGTGESAAANTGLGVGLGGAIPGLVSGLRAGLRPNQSTTDAALRAGNYGIPLAPADITRNGFVQGARSLTNDLPLIGLPGQLLKAKQQTALNEAVNATMGATGGKVEPATAHAARIGGELDRLWGNNTLKLDPTLFQDLQAVQAKAAQNLLPDQAKLVDNQIQQLLQRSNNAQIPGDFANNWQSELRLAVEGEKGLAKKTLNDLRQSVIRAFNRGVAPDDAAALTKARREYGNFKTLEDVINKGYLGVAGRDAGDIPAALLSGAVKTGQGGRAVGTDLGNLSEVAGRFLVDRAPQTGGSARAALQNTGVMGLAGFGGWAAPMATASAAAGGLTLNGLLTCPSMGRALLGNQPGRGLLGPSSLKLSAEEALKLGFQRSPLGMLGLFDSPALE